MKIECNKTMIAETRNNVDQLKKGFKNFRAIRKKYL